MVPILKHPQEAVLLANVEEDSDYSVIEGRGDTTLRAYTGD